MGVRSSGDFSRQSAMRLAFNVFGSPAAQGSKRYVGRGITIESSKKLKPWREAVRAEAAKVAEARGEVSPLDKPLYVKMVFTFGRPKGHYRTGRNAHLLRDNAPSRPSGKPDLCKLSRSTEDAITDAGVWRDDSRVVEYVRLAKVYAGEDRDALPVPGVKVVIMDYDDGGIPF